MIYDLKHPFAYKKDADTGKETMANAIEFRRPKGIESQLLFSLLNDMEQNGLGGDFAKNILRFIETFGQIVGDNNELLQDVSGKIDSKDLLAISAEAAENFT